MPLFIITPYFLVYQTENYYSKSILIYFPSEVIPELVSAYFPVEESLTDMCSIYLGNL